MFLGLHFIQQSQYNSVDPISVIARKSCFAKEPRHGGHTSKNNIYFSLLLLIVCSSTTQTEHYIRQAYG